MVFVLLFGCAVDNALRGGAELDTGAFDTRDTCGVEAGDTPIDVDALYAGDLPDGSEVPLDTVLLVDDRAGWDARFGRAAWAGEGLEPPDFETHQVVVTTASVDATCSFGVDSLAAWRDTDGVIHLLTTFVDRTGACDVACDASAAAVAVVAIPRGSNNPEVCVGREDACEL